MKYNKLGNTSLEVSEVGLGTLNFGGQVKQEDANEIVHYAFDHGINYFDTADMYEAGNSEVILGNAVRGIRSEIILASKVGMPTGKGVNQQGLSRRRVVDSLEKSLKRLGTDYLDIYFIHKADPYTSLEEIVDTFDGLIQAGKIRYYAISNHSSWQAADIEWTAKARRKSIPVASQVVYNLLARDLEREFLPFSKVHHTGIFVYNPLAGGLLSGKYQNINDLRENTRFSLKKNYQDRYWNQANFDAIEKLGAVAEKEGLSILELALNWVREREGISSTILGVSSLAQLEQNLSVYRETPLRDEANQAVDQIWSDLTNHRFQYNR